MGFSQSPTIYLGNNDNQNFHDVAAGLRIGGYTVALAVDGPDALAIFERGMPDLFLLDIATPGLDRYEVCQQLQLHVQTKDVPVIFIGHTERTTCPEKFLPIGQVHDNATSQRADTSPLLSPRMAKNLHPVQTQNHSGEATTPKSLPVSLTVPEVIAQVRAYLGAYQQQRSDRQQIAELQKQVVDLQLVIASHSTINEVYVALIDHPQHELTARECQVLALYAAGHARDDIAIALVVTKDTVRWYLKNIYSKLGVNRKADAVAYARAMGL